METRSKTSKKPQSNKRKSTNEYETQPILKTNSKKKRVNSKELQKKIKSKKIKNFDSLMDNDSILSSKPQIISSTDTNIFIDNNSIRSNCEYTKRSMSKRKEENEKNDIFIAIEKEDHPDENSKGSVSRQKTQSKAILKKRDHKGVRKPNKVIFDEQEESEREIENKGWERENIHNKNHKAENKPTNDSDRGDEGKQSNPTENDKEYKFKLRRFSSKNIHEQANPIIEKTLPQENYALQTERKTRSSSTKELTEKESLYKSKDILKSGYKITDEKNENINKSKKKDKYNDIYDKNNKNKIEINSLVSNTTSEEIEINLIDNDQKAKENKSKSKSKSKKRSKSKTKSKSVSKASSSPNVLPKFQDRGENEEQININSENILNKNDKLNHIFSSNTNSKNASTTNLFSFDYQNEECGGIAEKAELSSDITEKLSNSLTYCREAEKQRVLEFINNKDLKTLFICGQPGTGKTSLLLEIFKKDLRAAKTAIKIYINCMSVHSAEDFYYQILKFLIFEKFNLLDNQKDLNILHSYREVLNPKKNLNKSLLEILDLYKSKFTFLILLDEVDNFYQKQKEIVFYEILNTPYLTDTLIKLMLISNNSEFDKDVMPKIENRKIKVSRIVFKPYTHNEIYDILRKKLGDAGIRDVFQDEALKLISKKLANKMGDLRPAIEIVKNLILDNKAKISGYENNNNDLTNKNDKHKNNNTSNANSNSGIASKSHYNALNDKANGVLGDINDNKESKAKPLITLRDVLIKLKQKNQNFAELMNNLTTEQKIVLLSFYIIYDRSKNSEMDEKLILDTYKMIKRDNFNSEFNIMDYKEIIKSFCDMAIIECKNKAKGKFKIKYDLEDLELIFVDDKIFKMFKGN